MALEVKTTQVDMSECCGKPVFERTDCLNTSRDLGQHGTQPPKLVRHPALPVHFICSQCGKRCSVRVSSVTCVTPVRAKRKKPLDSPGLFGEYDDRPAEAPSVPVVLINRAMLDNLLVGDVLRFQSAAAWIKTGADCWQPEGLKVVWPTEEVLYRHATDPVVTGD